MKEKLGLGICAQGDGRTLVFYTSYGMMEFLQHDGSTIVCNHWSKATEPINP